MNTAKSGKKYSENGKNQKEPSTFHAGN